MFSLTRNRVTIEVIDQMVRPVLRTDIKLQTGFVMLGLTELERPGCCCSHWKMKDRVLLREILEGNLADLLYA